MGSRYTVISGRDPFTFQEGRYWGLKVLVDQVSN